MTERCHACGRLPETHLWGGVCPTGLTVTISADSIERCIQTGHPKLLGLVLLGKTTNAFTDVHIDGVKVSQEREAVSV